MKKCTLCPNQPEDPTKKQCKACAKAVKDWRSVYNAEVNKKV